MRTRFEDNYFNLDNLKSYMALSAREKLNYLEEINSFFRKVTPAESKKIWEELKKRGW